MGAGTGLISLGAGAVGLRPVKRCTPPRPQPPAPPPKGFYEGLPMPLCISCQSRVAAGAATCAVCLDSRKAKRKSRAAAGACGYGVTCGARPEPGKKFCAAHLAYYAKRNREARAKKREMPRPAAGSIVSLLNDFDAIL